jgi:hypothetical protein
MAKVGAVDGSAGYYVRGQVVGAGPGKAWGSGETKRQPYNVTLLVGRRTVDVEYQSEEAANAALVAAGASEGAPLLLRVFPRLGGPREHTAQCFIVYGGEFVSQS